MKKPEAIDYVRRRSSWCSFDARCQSCGRKGPDTVRDGLLRWLDSHGEPGGVQCPADAYAVQITARKMPPRIKPLGLPRTLRELDGLAEAFVKRYGREWNQQVEAKLKKELKQVFPDYFFGKERQILAVSAWEKMVYEVRRRQTGQDSLGRAKCVVCGGLMARKRDALPWLPPLLICGVPSCSHLGPSTCGKDSCRNTLWVQRKRSHRNEYMRNYNRQRRARQRGQFGVPRDGGGK